MMVPRTLRRRRSAALPPARGTRDAAPRHRPMSRCLAEMSRAFPRARWSRYPGPAISILIDPQSRAWRRVMSALADTLSGWPADRGA